MPLDFAERLERFDSPVYRDLRAAQEHVLQAYADTLLSSRDLAVELPTGVGKTLIALLIADWALDEGLSVAYLTGTRQLAEQVQEQAHDLGDLTLHHFWGGHYPGGALHDYHQAQAVGIMNYWVYFNSRPIPQPADLVLFDDAHVAEQPLAALFSLRIERREWNELYVAICDLVLARTNAYPALQAMREGSAPFYTPPELLAFNDWTAVVEAAEATLSASDFTKTDARWVWTELRGKLERCGVLVGPSAIEIRPYHPPTQTVPGYANSRQCIYLSATLGTMDDLQRRLGTRRITPLEVPAHLRQEQTGERVLLLNPTNDSQLDEGPLQFAIHQTNRTNRVAWLCSSHAEADFIQDHLRDQGSPTYRLRRDDSMLDEWRGSAAGHLITAGRFDGLDFPGDTCRLVVIPSVPASTTEFERFAVAYLGDATFMRHRVGQRVTQALGRANRDSEDRALYLGLDPSFGTLLADPAVTASLAEDVRPTIRSALELHGGPWAPVVQAADRFWRSEAAGRVAEPRRRRGRIATVVGGATADAEVDASTSLWVGDYARAAQKASAASAELRTRQEVEHAAFWSYVEAHAHWLSGRDGDLNAARAAISNSVEEGPRTAWFVRLRRTVDEIDGRRVDSAGHDALFHKWEEWIRESGGRVTSQINQARNDLQGTHDQQAAALDLLARLCGATADHPSEESAADSRWRWVTPQRTECRVWDVKTGTAPDRVPRSDVNQVLGQITVEARRSSGARVFGCLLTPQLEMEVDAAAAAHDKIAVLNHRAIRVFFDLLADRFTLYLQFRGSGTASERGDARDAVERRLPSPGWLTRVLSPSQGRCRTAQDIDREFPRT